MSEQREWELLGAFWPDDAGDELTDASTDLVPLLKPGKLVTWVPASSAGRWEPLANGDPTDPQPVYTDDGDFLMIWMED